MQIGTFFGFSVIISASDDDCVGESEVCCPIQFTGTDGLYERGLAFDNVMDSCGQPALPPEKINLFQYSGPVYVYVWRRVRRAFQSPEPGGLEKLFLVRTISC